jgi:putative protease
MHKPELLAPAGSKEALISAIENGADAVYFGGKIFSARQYASNFSREELEWAIDYTHKWGVKAYVTMNTLIKDSELEDACEYLQFLCNIGADALIVQDFGILRLLREQLPELPLHASTQMTIHNIEGVKFLQEMGIKRVVLARELSLDEIKRIKSETTLELETFIHGALCFSYSGQCLLSSMIGGRSGNRGYCAQPCRKKYRIKEAEGYLLSPKDLNMSEHIGTLIEAGIDSFKIEGRMKRYEYIAGVVRVYRNLIDRYFEAPSSFQVTEDEQHMLLQLFNRGFTTGYFFGSPGSELMSRKYPHNLGTELGRVIDYDPRRKLASIYLKAPLRTGDGVGIRGRETGFIIRIMYVDNQRAMEAGTGSTVKVPVDHVVATGDAVFKTHDSQLMASLEMINIRKIPIKMFFKARAGEPSELYVSDGENEIIVNGGMVSRAEIKPMSNNLIAAQLKKLGNTVFEADEISFEIDENIFVPVSELNFLRRRTVVQLEAKRAQKWKRRCKKPEITAEKKNTEVKPILAVNTNTIEGFEAAVDSGADAVYIGGDITENNEPQISPNNYTLEYGHKQGVKVFITTPRIAKEISAMNTDLNPDGYLVGNLGVLYSLRMLNKPVVIDYPFNVFNRLTLDYLLKYCQRVTLSPELTLKEIRNLAPFGATECIVHGFFPLMVSEHDLVGGLFSNSRARDVLLKDEKGFAFPVKTDLQNRTYVMNSRELCMLEYIPEIIRTGLNCIRIEARTYEGDATREITRAYREAIDNSVEGKVVEKQCAGEYTTGHYFRGVL